MSLYNPCHLCYANSFLLLLISTPQIQEVVLEAKSDNTKPVTCVLKEYMTWLESGGHHSAIHFLHCLNHVVLHSLVVTDDEREHDPFEYLTATIDKL